MLIRIINGTLCEIDNLVQYLIDNLATKSHPWAMRELKSYFGDYQGLSKKIKKVAECMVREASKPHLGTIRETSGLSNQCMCKLCR